MTATTHPLKRYRQQVELSLSDLAGKTGTTRQSLFRIEAGQQIPSVDLIRRILAALPEAGLTADDFVSCAPPRRPRAVPPADLPAT